jgi:hypothetical protein
MSSFHIAVSACSGESGRNAQLSHGSRSEADWSEGSQIRALSSGSHPAIRANGELAPIEFDVMIGMQVHPRALHFGQQSVVPGIALSALAARRVRRFGGRRTSSLTGIFTPKTGRQKCDNPAGFQRIPRGYFWLRCRRTHWQC